VAALVPGGGDRADLRLEADEADLRRAQSLADLRLAFLGLGQLRPRVVVADRRLLELLAQVRRAALVIGIGVRGYGEAQH
jgi:hypothetical protein